MPDARWRGAEQGSHRFASARRGEVQGHPAGPGADLRLGALCGYALDGAAAEMGDAVPPLGSGFFVAPNWALT